MPPWPRIAVWLLVAGGCSSEPASFERCSILCSSADGCPKGLLCGIDGYCHAEAGDECPVQDGGNGGDGSGGGDGPVDALGAGDGACRDGDPCDPADPCKRCQDGRCETLPVPLGCSATISDIYFTCFTTTSCYLSCSSTYTWSTALSVCESWSEGASLVSIETADEGACVNRVSGYFWYGLYQTAGATEPAGGWTWLSGAPVTAVTWEAGEPNDSPAGSDCGLHVSGGNEFRDEPCDGTYSFYCELPSPE